jgi:hypothetical protein
LAREPSSDHSPALLRHGWQLAFLRKCSQNGKGTEKGSGVDNAFFRFVISTLDPFFLACVSALGFFVPGLKYYRQRLRANRPAR